MNLFFPWDGTQVGRMVLGMASPVLRAPCGLTQVRQALRCKFSEGLRFSLELSSIIYVHHNM